jgi:hypothetical protein
MSSNADNDGELPVTADDDVTVGRYRAVFTGADRIIYDDEATGGWIQSSVPLWLDHWR